MEQPKNARSARRHGNAWRSLDDRRKAPRRWTDFDGNEIQPLTRRDWPWIVGALVLCVAVWTAGIWLVRWLWTRGGA